MFWKDTQIQRNGYCHIISSNQQWSKSIIRNGVSKRILYPKSIRSFGITTCLNFPSLKRITWGRLPVAFLSSEGSWKRKVFESFWQSRSPSLVLICYLQQTCDSIPQSRNIILLWKSTLIFLETFVNAIWQGFPSIYNAMQWSIVYFVILKKRFSSNCHYMPFLGIRNDFCNFGARTRGLRYPGQFLSVARLLHECNKTFLKIIWWSSTTHDNLFWSTPTHKQQSWR